MPDTTTTSRSAEITTIDIGAATWREFTIPGSNTPVHLTRLGAHPDGGFDVLVRFPTGWSRPGPGHYDAIEEVTFIAGGFRMSGRTYRAGDYGWFPTSFTRTDSAAPTGALALAWFSQPNEWSESVSPAAEAAADGLELATWTEAETATSPLGVTGWALRRAADRETWIVQSVPEQTDVPAGIARVDLFDLAGHRWHTVPAGATLPAVEPGPVWARVIMR
ncbi:hypothetical protein [Euzebya tangerina]|uniref:hypothetical protein n=1 Tax=Euzebya tangerina TaxID=591198 RepID=UPI0013C2A35D|nr:hypothetical protein [Euzebya tangerina]